MAKEKQQAVEIEIPAVEPRTIPRPKIEVLNRSLQNVFGLPSEAIELTDPAFVCHWVNTTISGAQLGKYLDAGYMKTEPWMLKDTDRVAFTVSPDGYVTRGQRHEEILLYTLKDHYAKRQAEKARKNRDAMNPYTTKQQLVAAASAKLGDEAANYLDRHTGPVGEVVDSYERIERRPEGSE
jgi:hypothetical protein